jgi:hypothetical protein
MLFFGGCWCSDGPGRRAVQRCRALPRFRLSKNDNEELELIVSCFWSPVDVSYGPSSSFLSTLTFELTSRAQLGVAAINASVFGVYKLAMNLQLPDPTAAPTLTQITLAGSASGVLTAFVQHPLSPPPPPPLPRPPLPF